MSRLNEICVNNGASYIICIIITRIVDYIAFEFMLQIPIHLHTWNSNCNIDFVIEAIYEIYVLVTLDID